MNIMVKTGILAPESTGKHDRRWMMGVNAELLDELLAEREGLYTKRDQKHEQAKILKEEANQLWEDIDVIGSRISDHLQGSIK